MQTYYQATLSFSRIPIDVGRKCPYISLTAHSAEGQPYEMFSASPNSILNGFLHSDK